jgi:hypothetical protein
MCHEWHLELKEYMKAFACLDKFNALGPRIFLLKYYVENLDKLMKHHAY